MRPLDFWEVVGRVADVAALPGLVVGFIITGRQIAKTRSEATAAREAAEASQKAISWSVLLMLVPQLAGVEDDLTRAIRTSDSELAIRSLLDWRRKANQLRGLLKAAGYADDALQISIQESVTFAFESTLNLTSPDFMVGAKDTLRAISCVTDELTIVASEQGIKSGGSSNAG